MWTLHNFVNRMFDDVVNREQGSTGFGWGMPMDVVESGSEYIVKAALPGLRPEELEVTYNKGTLTIQGELKDDLNIDQPEGGEQKEQREGYRYHLRERSFGTFQRSITLPNQVDADRIEAHYDSGVLTLRLPKVEAVKPKRIEVRSDSNKMLEGKLN